MSYYMGPDLPEEISQHIHSLLPLRDAARAACISHAFLSSWRQHPNLTLTRKSLGCSDDFTEKVNHILNHHSGVGVKKLHLECYDSYDCSHLDCWLQSTITPLLEELTLKVWSGYYSELQCSPLLNYTFPVSILSGGSAIQNLDLGGCSFRPTVELGRLGSLTRLHLHYVGITGDELECFLSCSSPVLERLKLVCCNEIDCLKIPGTLHRLSYLHVHQCLSMKKVENKAENLRTIYFGGLPALLYSPGEYLQLGQLLQLKNIDMIMRCNDAVNYARTELPSIAPNLETLTMTSMPEMFNAPTAPSKFLHLKYLFIRLGGLNLSPAYDYFSLASFIDASPSLETFILNLPQQLMEHDWIFGGSSDLRPPVTEYRHHNLRSVEITGFNSAKSLLELTCYILSSTTSLERITLDTTLLHTIKCSGNKYKKCISIRKGDIMEARMALLAIEKYIKRKVPATVQFNVVEPCRRCHVV